MAAIETASPSADLGELTALAQTALGALTAAGADAADVVVSRRASRSVMVRNGKLEEVEDDTGRGIDLRAFMGNRSATVSVVERRDIAEAAERAVAMARAAPEDPSEGLADAAQLGRYAGDLDLYDPTDLSAEALAERARAVEDAMYDVDGVTNSIGASAATSANARVLATSHGFVGASAGTMMSHGVTAVAGEGVGMERDSWYCLRRHIADLESAAETGRTAGRLAVQRLGGKAVPTQTAPVVFEPRVASGLLAHITGALNGTAVARGASIFAGRKGERILPAGITIVDDPFVVRGFASRPFDGEGVTGEAMPLVEDGVLANYLLDQASARRLGVSSNGRAVRAGARPAPSATNVRVEGGRGDLASLLADLGDGFLVTSLIGQGANLITGAYSRGASGFLFRNGAIAEPVTEVTIAGDLPAMLASLLVADDAPGRSALDAPTMAIPALTIGGR